MSDYEISTIRYAKTIYKHQNKTRSLPKNLNEIHAKLTTKNLKKQKVIKAKENNKNTKTNKNKNSEVIDYEQYPLPSHVKKVEKVMRSELKKEAANKKKELQDNRDSQVKLNNNYKMSEILPDLEQEKELLTVYQMSPVVGGRFGGD